MIRQHHHWGVIEHGIRQLVESVTVTDELIYEFMSIEELLTSFISLDRINQFLEKGGGIELIDTPAGLTYMHTIEIWAYHPDPKQLTWIAIR